jgi:hypothetical protein
MRRVRTDDLQLASQFVRFVPSFLKTESLPQSPDVCLQERAALRQSSDATVRGFRAFAISRWLEAVRASGIGWRRFVWCAS